MWNNTSHELQAARRVRRIRLPDPSSESTSSEFDDTVLVEPADVRDFNDANILPQSPSTVRKIGRWLRPAANDSEDSEGSEDGKDGKDGEYGEYRTCLALLLEGTGSWLFSHAAYREWMSSCEDGLLWIRGTLAKPSRSVA